VRQVNKYVCTLPSAQANERVIAVFMHTNGALSAMKTSKSPEQVIADCQSALMAPATSISLSSALCQAALTMGKKLPKLLTNNFDLKFDYSKVNSCFKNYFIFQLESDFEASGIGYLYQILL
jgi:hypothetical protein